MINWRYCYLILADGTECSCYAEWLPWLYADIDIVLIIWS